MVLADISLIMKYHLSCSRKGLQKIQDSRNMRDRMLDKWQTRWASYQYRKLNKKTGFGKGEM